MKKWIRLIYITLLLTVLAACNIQSVEQFEQMEAREQSIEPPPSEQPIEIAEPEVMEEIATPTPEQKEESTPVTPPQEPVEIPVTEEEAPVEAKTAEQPVAKEPPIEKPLTIITRPGKPVAQEEPPVAAAPPADKLAEQTPANNEQTAEPISETTEALLAPAKATRSVTIAIRVDTLLKHWDLLDPSLQSEQYVPANGIILNTTAYELLTEDDTVWDVLQRATKEHNIHLEYEGADQNIYNSVYIEGINHLYEFSAGSLSGWMYKVNGVYPNYGASQYELADGDVIEWHYTVDLGRDLGHEWTGEQ